MNFVLIESTDSSSDCEKRDQRVPCKWGSKCRDIGDKRHCEKYSHSLKQQHSAHQIPCKWGLQCRTMNDRHHTAKYSHPKAQEEKEDESSSESETSAHQF